MKSLLNYGTFVLLTTYPPFVILALTKTKQEVHRLFWFIGRIKDTPRLLDTPSSTTWIYSYASLVYLTYMMFIVITDIFIEISTARDTVHKNKSKDSKSRGKVKADEVECPDVKTISLSSSYSFDYSTSTKVPIPQNTPEEVI